LAAEKYNLEQLHEILKWAEKKLPTEEINNTLLFGTDSEGRTGHHIGEN